MVVRCVTYFSLKNITIYRKTEKIFLLLNMMETEMKFTFFPPTLCWALQYEMFTYIFHDSAAAIAAAAGAATTPSNIL